MQAGGGGSGGLPVTPLFKSIIFITHCKVGANVINDQIFLDLI